MEGAASTVEEGPGGLNRGLSVPVQFRGAVMGNADSHYKSKGAQNRDGSTPLSSPLSNSDDGLLRACRTSAARPCWRMTSWSHASASPSPSICRWTGCPVQPYRGVIMSDPLLDGRRTVKREKSERFAQPGDLSTESRFPTASVLLSERRWV